MWIYYQVPTIVVFKSSRYRGDDPMRSMWSISLAYRLATPAEWRVWNAMVSSDNRD